MVGFVLFFFFLASSSGGSGSGGGSSSSSIGVSVGGGTCIKLSAILIDFSFYIMSSNDICWFGSSIGGDDSGLFYAYAFFFVLFFRLINWWKNNIMKI